MPKKRSPSGDVLLGRVMSSIRAAKGKVKGMAWKQLHRMESMGATALKIKSKTRAKPTKRKKKAKTK